jgi:uncharacterized protein YehS (DUF1456 family)
MTNNDILRRLRFTFDLNDNAMINTFYLGGLEVTRAEISDWLKKDDDPAFQEIKDKEFAIFLNGFIVSKRGKKDGEIPPAEKSLNNNIIFRKLKIALNLMDDDVIDIMKSVDLRVSKHEISSFFRKPTQDKYRVCHDQFLRNFLQGLQLKYTVDKK